VDDLEGELAEQGIERLAERELVGGLGFHAHAGRPARLHDDRVAGRELSVDADAVEGALDADTREEIERRGIERGVCLHEAEHGRVARRDHAGALRLGSQANGPGGKRHLEAGALGSGVAREDGPGEVVRVGPKGAARSPYAVHHLLARQLRADHARRRHRDLPRLHAQLLGR
jgi:hypothetical protein